MLSDEEKKALKELTEIKELVEEDLKYEDYNVTATLDQIDLESLVIVLNLIEKQSKEIEEYKKQLDLDYVDKHFVPIERYNQLEKEIEDNKKYIDLHYVPYEHYISKLNELNKKWKDKIKAKIEEVEQWELYNMKIPRLSTLDERLGAKIGIKYVLQSLLEKE